MASSAFSYRSKDKSSDSDSENSDTDSKDWKRATRRPKDENLERIPIVPPTVGPSPLEPLPSTNEEKVGPPKRKRNNIWCEVLEDQLMSETLNHCGIKNKPIGFGERGEESYDYTLSYKYFKKDEDSDKMSEDEMSDLSKTNPKPYQSKRHKNSKFVKLDGPEKKVAQKIIHALGERKHYLIFRVVKYIGVEKSLELLKKTEEVEESGGMMVKNQVRRRTPGGVYFQLLKTDKNVKKSAVDKIFEDELNSYQLKKLSEERKMQKKLKAEKKKILEEFSMFENKQVHSDEQKIDLKMEDEKIDLNMEDDEMETPVQTMPVSNNIIDSDVEEGEIND